MNAPFRFTQTFTVLLGLMAFSLQAATITVNFVGDTAADDSHCTLREAITAANTNATSGPSAGECAAGSALGMDTIAFNVGGGGAQTINLVSLLPTITSRVNIDGTTQPSYAPGTGMIRVDGNVLSLVLNLDSGSASSTVKGLMLTGAQKEINATTDFNTFQGNYIGTDGSTGGVNIDTGLSISGSNTLIGGTTAGMGNLISGAYNFNLRIDGNSNVVQGNIIGTDATGTTSLFPGGTNIFVYGASNTIGGTTPGAGNLISGNTYGILFGLGATANTVQGNKIGTNLAGSATVAGSGTGIYIFSTPGNVIGGSAIGAGNLISGNTAYGIYIEGNASIGTVIQGNYIGTNAAGAAAIPNGKGIWLTNAMGTVVGGASSGEGNVVSGNTIEGILVDGVNAIPNTVQGNKIGTNAAGTAALANSVGLRISSGNNTIGGSSAGTGNLISGNTQRGVSLDGGALALGNVLRGNFIGTNAAGSSAIPNGDGIFIGNAPNTVIGGTAAGQGNLVSGNTTFGIQIGNSTGHVITANNIGANATGTGALPNGAAGIYLTLSASVQVNQNLIANHNGTGDFGIYLDSSAIFAASSDNNCIINNDAGVQNDTGTSTTFANNWWGHSSGPSGAGAGSGDSVSANVVFTPWLTVTPACPGVLNEVFFKNGFEAVVP